MTAARCRATRRVSVLPSQDRNCTARLRARLVSRLVRIARAFFDEPADSNEFDRLTRMRRCSRYAKTVYFSGEVYADRMKLIGKTLDFAWFLRRVINRVGIDAGATLRVTAAFLAGIAARGRA